MYVVDVVTIGCRAYTIYDCKYCSMLQQLRLFLKLLLLLNNYHMIVNTRVCIVFVIINLLGTPLFILLLLACFNIIINNDSIY